MSKIQKTTCSLNKIHSSWKGFLIQTAFDTLLCGMESERSRLHGLPFITCRFDQVYDYDGLTESLELLEGFLDPASAIQYVEQLAENTLIESLAKPGLGDSKWRHELSVDNISVKLSEPKSAVQGIYRRSLNLTLDTGYDNKIFLFEVLQVGVTDAIGSRLFNYREAKSEWMDYFISKGK